MNMLLALTVAACIAGFGYLALNPANKPNTSKIASHSELSSLKGDGLIISENVRLSRKYSNEHALVVMPTGAGKTRRIAMPNVRNLKNCSLVVTDPKCEIARECITDKKTMILNPYNSNTVGYDILENCNNTTEVRKYAKVLLVNGNLANQILTGASAGSEAVEWLQKATPLLNAYMIYNYYMKRYKFHEMVQRLVSAPLKEIGQEIMNSNVTEAKIEFQSFIQIAGSPVTLSCIRNVLLTNLQLFLDSSINNLMSRPSIDLNKLRDEETILYIQIPERDAAYFSPLTAVLVTQILDRLMDNEDGLQTYLILDEMANIGKINGLSQTLSTCRSRRVSILGCIQSLGQLELVYNSESKVLTELFKTVVFSGGLKDSSEYASELVGLGKFHKNNDTYVDKLMSSDAIRRLKDDELLIICGNKNPVIDKMHKWG
jgi:type IV secretion system protein VirD4